MAKKEPEFDFTKDLKRANIMADLSERLLYLKERLDEHSKFNSWDLSGYEKAMKKEIRFTENLILSQNKEVVTKPVQAEKIASNIQPIWWKKSNRLLGYLMEELAKLDMIDKDSPINKHIKEHFIDKNKELFKASITQNRSGAGNNKGTSKNKGTKPKGHTDIDNTLKRISEQGQ